MLRNNRTFLSLISLILGVSLVACQLNFEKTVEANQEFNPERAFRDLSYQVSLGSRTIGSQAHSTVVDWIYSELEKSGWRAERQTADWNGNEITNIIGKRGEGSPWIILGAHYDSRFIADRDPALKMRDQPVPGANDGASGVAVLLELARVMPSNLDKQVWLVFFDAEDNGNIAGWEWSIGASIFVDELELKPDAVVVLDMIGDKDLNIYKEKNSDPSLTDQIWSLANQSGYNQFIPEYNHRLIDDHIPFLQQEIPAALIIDFDYPYWHTTEDNIDKVSADSLAAVGNTVLSWVKQEP